MAALAGGGVAWLVVLALLPGEGLRGGFLRGGAGVRWDGVDFLCGGAGFLHGGADVLWDGRNFLWAGWAARCGTAARTTCGWAAGGLWGGLFLLLPLSRGMPPRAEPSGPSQAGRAGQAGPSRASQAEPN
ncbi:hypothetical protein [Streptomyces sp. NPDC058249]|uniref:hypothetical protein n=1 Tax=Streptomyces sp. NPDC058249 TaxID=3346403 RepID=UPI0036F12FCF